MKISFSKLIIQSSGSVAIGFFEGDKFAKFSNSINTKTKDILSAAVKHHKFTGKKDQFISLIAPPSSGYKNIFLFGLGPSGKLKDSDMEEVGGYLFSKLQKNDEIKIIIDNQKIPKNKMVRFASLLASGMYLRAYNFNKYFTKKDKLQKTQLRSVSIVSSDVTTSRKLFNELKIINDGVIFTRNLVSEPANVLTPLSFAKQIKALSSKGLKVKVLTVPEMRRMGMNALLGVAQGSSNPPRVAVMEWSGGSKKQETIAFVGKGVCFDSGGISIKPSHGMWDMKWDMGGAAVVSGLMKSLAERKAKVNAVGIIGLVENMPDGNAQRPGDVVKSANGQTIEVQNTDAEGRLVLADILWYVQKNHKPDYIIDLATLTGAVIVALSKYYCGLFSNDDNLSSNLISAGISTNERLWRLPIGPEYDRLINSSIADMKNIGPRDAGAITAAQFIKRFINDGVKWAHLDIAGVTWSEINTKLSSKGATGYGVRLLDRFVRDNLENNS